MAASVNFLKYQARAHEMKLAGGIEAFDKVRHLMRSQSKSATNH